MSILDQPPRAWMWRGIRFLTALVLLAGWLAAMLPPLSAIVLWKSYGGSVFMPELVKLMVEADIAALEEGSLIEIDRPDLPGWRPAS